MELELGYFQSRSSLSDVWAVPLMINGRAALPLADFELYGGFGVGTIYYDGEAPRDGADDGFAFATNGFAGFNFTFAEEIVIGVEGKFYRTNDDDVPSAIEGFAALITLGVRY